MEEHDFKISLREAILLRELLIDRETSADSQAYEAKEQGEIFIEAEMLAEQAICQKLLKKLEALEKDPEEDSPDSQE